MLSTTRTRVALTALAVVAATLLASCETPPPPPPPVVAAPPAPPPITLSSSIVEKASAFRGYMARAGAISPNFQNGDDIQSSLKVGVAYEPKQLLSGVIAYAAVIALQGADNAKSQEHRLASFAALIGRISQHARQGSRLSVQVSEHIHHQAQQIPRILSQA